MGTTKTIKSLEKDKREKEQQIKVLQVELEKKDRIIDSLRNENMNPNIKGKIVRFYFLSHYYRTI